MWDFLQYIFSERAFSLFWGVLEITEVGARVEAGVEARAEAGVEVRVQISRTALKVCCKSSLEYLRTSVALTDKVSKNESDLDVNR